jgi:hypothetical protein
MSEKMDTFIDRISRKEEKVIGINGNCNDEGILEQILTDSVSLNPNVTHKIALSSLAGTSFFPNLTKASNKFYYSTGGSEIKTVTLQRGTYEIKDYNEKVKKFIELAGDNKDNITISLCAATGKTEIELKGGYKVYFSTKSEALHSWRECLGFDAIDLTTDGVHTSKFVAEVLPSQMIYVGCNICRGSLGNRDKRIRSNVLFSFPNNKTFGTPFVLEPNPLRPREVLLKEFDTIRLHFTDDDGNPVNFLGAQVTGEIYIYQV